MISLLFFRNPYKTLCLSTWGGPPEPFLVIGGSESNPRLAKGLIFTFLLKNTNHLKPSAMAWEKRFIHFLSNYTNDLFDVTFNTERSIEDQIEEMSNSEFITVIIGYFVMFVYFLSAIACKRNCHVLWPRILLAFGGIATIMASVIASMGFFQYWDVETTWLTIEVIPFLILAIGVDNIFIMVRTFEQQDEQQQHDVKEGIGKMLEKVGPSICLTAMSETGCFAVGILVEMPAVKTFAMYATVAVFLNFVLQMTAFVALMSITEGLGRKGSKGLEESPGLIYEMLKKFMKLLKKR